MIPLDRIGDIVLFHRSLGEWVPAVVETVYSEDTIGLCFFFRGKTEFRNANRGTKVENYKRKDSPGVDDAKTPTRVSGLSSGVNAV